MLRLLGVRLNPLSRTAIGIVLLGVGIGLHATLLTVVGIALSLWGLVSAVGNKFGHDESEEPPR
jgi:hypothetical protein